MQLCHNFDTILTLFTDNKFNLWKIIMYFVKWWKYEQKPLEEGEKKWPFFFYKPHGTFQKNLSKVTIQERR